MSVFDLIIKWAKNDLPPWQSDAVRRLLTQGKLDQADHDELLYFLKEEYGLSKEKLDVLPKPINTLDGVEKKKPTRITLKAMQELKGVNAIKDGSSLKFGHQGLSVIYGENGAGKSGYARVLKRACTARDSKEKILPNVYENVQNSIASAKFKVSINEYPDKLIEWNDNNKSISILSKICFFDSKCANVIVDNNNEITYLPYGAFVFEELVSLLRILKSRLENEKPIVEKLKYSDIDPLSSIGKFIENINFNTQIDELERLSGWTETDENILIDLTRQVFDAEINDPKKQAKRIRSIKERIKQIGEHIVKISKVISNENITKVNNSIREYNTAQKALALATEDSLTNEPLNGVKSNEWQLLYQAAKNYSIKYAYPSLCFPQSTDQSLCVLCMQPLSKEAQKRIVSFKNYMEDDLKVAFEATRISYEKDVSEIIELKTISIDSITDIIDEINDQDTLFAKKMVNFLSASVHILIQYNDVLGKKQYIDFIDFEQFHEKDFDELVEKLEQKAFNIEQSASPEILNKLKKRKEEYEAKKLLSQRKEEIREYINNIKLIKKYNDCISATATTSITQKGRKIVSGALTPMLQDVIKKELMFFNLTHLQLNLKPSGEAGEIKHKFELKNCKITKICISDILSEGEQRVAALAGFFAELSSSEFKYPIVFDDPVTSLDHRFREKIAERIVLESKTRQVIVFTHDIAFLSILRKKVGEHRVAFWPQSIYKHMYAGECLDFPWHAMGVTDRIKYLNSERDKIQSLYGTNTYEYDQRAAQLYAMLRETWEACVEEVLFYETIRRFSGEIQTQRIKAVNVTTEDYREIDLGMSKCSSWMYGHDKSESVDVHRPCPEEIRNDIACLKAFVNKINKRRDAVRREREDALKPIVPSVG